MPGKFLLAAACAAFVSSSALAQQAPSTWTFNYTDFVERDTGQAAPYALGGSFSGSDLDQDGVLGLSELVSLEIFGRDFLGCAPSFEGMESYCNATGFSYRIGAGLDFDLRRTDIESAPPSGWIYHAIAGDQVELTHVGHRGAVSSTFYLWTPQTQLLIAGPVPEPSTPAMLALGVGMLGLLDRLRVYARRAPF